MMHRPRRERLVLSVLLVASATASTCNGGEPAIDRRIWRMVRCIECMEGEQAAVVAMGQGAIPALRYFLLNGPPDTTVARKESALRAPLRPPSPTLGPIIPSTIYVKRRVEDFVATFRIRSSYALGLIGTDSARRVLCRGKTMQFRPDVVRAIDSSLTILHGSCP
jgi:hypothetical protein